MFAPRDRGEHVGVHVATEGVRRHLARADGNRQRGGRGERLGLPAAASVGVDQGEPDRQRDLAARRSRSRVRRRRHGSCGADRRPTASSRRGNLSERRTPVGAAGSGLSAGPSRLADMRPVTDLERRVAPFKVVSDYQPSGDQPDRDRGDHGASQRRRPGRRAARCDRHRQDRERGLGGRAAPAPDAGPPAQQDAGRPVRQRAAPAVPRQRGRILRQLLRLLPARGLRPADRHLHREGLLHQRGGRAAAALGDQLAADASRRDRGVDGVLHLRPRHPAGVPRPDAPAQGRRRARPRLDPSAAGRDPIHAQRHVVHPRHVPGPRRHPRGVPGLRGAGDPGRVLRRRGRADDDPAPGDRRGGHRGQGAAHLPGDPLRRRPAAHGARDPRHRGGARATSCRRSSGRGRCWRPNGCGCARRTTWR